MRDKQICIIAMIILFISILPAIAHFGNGRWYHQIIIDNSDKVFIEYRNYDEEAPRESLQLLKFDSEGNFIKRLNELGEKMNLDQQGNLVDFIDAKGNFWRIMYDYTDGKQKTRIEIFGKENKYVSVVEKEGMHSFYVTPKHEIYAYTQNKNNIEISHYNADKSVLENLFIIKDYDSKGPSGCTLSEDEQEMLYPKAKFVMDEQNNVFYLLFPKRYKAEVRKYSSEGKLLKSWLVVPEPVDARSEIQNIYLDSFGSLYVIHNSSLGETSGKSSGSIIKYDGEGNLLLRIKEKFSDIFRIAVDSKGNIYVIQSSKKDVIKFNSSGKYVLMWDATPPAPGESWAKKREIEKSLKNLNENSPDEILLRALTDSDYDNVRKAERLIITRGLKMLPALVQLMKEKENNRLEYVKNVLAKVVESKGEEGITVLTQFFLNADDSTRSLMADLVASFRQGKEELPEVTKLINQRERERKDLTAISTVPLEQETINSYLQELEKSDSFSMAGFSLSFQINKTFPSLKKIFLDPKNPLRERIRGILLSGNYYVDKAKYSCTNDSDSFGAQYKGQVISAILPDSHDKGEIPLLNELKELAQSSDLYVRDTAIIILNMNDVAGYEKELIEIARRDEDLQNTILWVMKLSWDKHNDIFEPLIPQIFELIDKGIASKPPMDRMQMRKLMEQGDAKASRAAMLDMMSLQNKLEPLIEMNDKEIDTRIMKYLFRSDIPEHTKDFIVNRYGEESRIYLEQEMLALLDQPISKRMQEAVINALAQYKTEIAIPKLIEILKQPVQPDKNDDRMDFSYDKMLKDSIVRCLGQIGNKLSLPVLMEYFAQTPDCNEKASILHAVAQIGSDDKTDKLLLSLLDDEYLGLNAAIAMAKNGRKEALPVIIDGMKIYDDYRGNILNVDCFKSFGMEGKAALIKLLDYDNQDTQIAVAEILSQLKAVEARDKVASIYNDKNLSFRYHEKHLVKALLLLGADPFPMLVERSQELPDLDIKEIMDDKEASEAAYNLLEQHLSTEKDSLKAAHYLLMLESTGSSRALDIIKKWTPRDEKYLKLTEKVLYCLSK